MTQDKARKRAARERAAATGESYTRAARLAAALGAGRPAHIEVVEPPEPFERSDPRVRWGVVERVGTGYRITVTPYGNSAVRAAEQYPPARVDYTAPESWEPASAELLPVAWQRNDGRWIWAVNGWAVDDPGDVADAPACPSPSSALPYEVRVFLASRDGSTWGVDYSGSQPNWSTCCWCESVEQAHILAGAAVRWRDGAWRAQVWGPGRAKLSNVDAAADRPVKPSRPFGTLPGPRPASPAPASVPPKRPNLSRRDGGYDIHLRVCSPATGWISAGWYSMRQLANVAASDLCVGVDGYPWEFGDIWGPPRDERELPKRALFDLIPDHLWNEPYGPTLVEPAELPPAHVRRP